MQAFIKDGKLIVNSQILPNEKEKLLEFIEKAETFLVSATTLYDIKGDKAGIEFNIKDDVIIEEVSLDPSEETQTLEGLFDKITISAIPTQEKTENLNFSGVDSIEFDSDENGYIKKITIVKDENLVPENIKLGITINGIEGNLEPDKPDQNKTVDPSEEVQEVRADTGYELASVTINAIPSDYVRPEGTMNINENGEYNVTNYAGVNVGVEIPKIFIDRGVTFSLSTCKTIDFLEYCDTGNLDFFEMFRQCYYLKSIPNINTSGAITFENCFKHCYNLTAIPNIDTSKAWKLSNAFYGCYSITSIPVLNTSNVSQFDYCFCACNSLITVPIFNFSKASNLYRMFVTCPNLSNDSLNNIMTSCINVTNISSGNKRLSYLGLTESQINICKDLPSFTDLTNAGWLAN